MKLQNKKINILTSVHPPFDDRIFHKEAKTLVKAGYDVILIAQHNEEEVVDGVRIVPLPKPRSRFERMTKVVWKLFKLALKKKADVYHFHDPELIPVGLVLRLFGKRVIYDVHEDAPKQILNKNWIRSHIVRKLVSFFFNIFERFSCMFFNAVVAATPDIAKKFPPQKTIILRNFPILGLIDKVKAINGNKQKSIIIYAGGLSRIRGIKEIIQAMEFVKDKAELQLLGKWESKEFKRECENLKGWKYTRYLGSKSLEEVYSYIKVADIGISMLYPVKNYVTGLPVKAFEYMACSLPMVMSNFPYWKEIFGECALFADPYNPKEIAEKILYLLDNSDKAKRLGNNGRKLVEKKYSWEAEQRRLLDIYERVLNK